MTQLTLKPASSFAEVISEKFSCLSLKMSKSLKEWPATELSSHGIRSTGAKKKGTVQENQNADTSNERSVADR